MAAPHPRCAGQALALGAKEWVSRASCGYLVT